MHHRLPKDMIGLASWATFLAFAGIWLLADVFAGLAIGAAFTTMATTQNSRATSPS